MKDNDKEICKGGCHGNCYVCQNEQRRASKRHSNHYRAHGPCQTNETRTWRTEGRKAS